MNQTRMRRRGWDWIPWVVLAVPACLASWYLLDYESDPDTEFPAVVRPQFSVWPSPAYRVAEPGDTLDRVGVYLASASLVVGAVGGVAAIRRGGSVRPWLASGIVSLLAFWTSANPGPTFDGWHGWGWPAIVNPNAPLGLRVGLAVGLLVGVLGIVWACRGQGLVTSARGQRTPVGLLVLLAALSLIDLPGLGPTGFWMRWAWIGALSMWLLVLVRSVPRAAEDRSWRRMIVLGTAGAGIWVGCVAQGLTLIWYHRPLERLRAVVPGRIFISAMPSPEGLPVAHARHRFKTIVNLYPEGKLARSSRLPQELKFARENGIRYYESPGEASQADAFLDLTLRLSQDPDAWPMLVHCHACMDRTPAWMGIYRFVVQGRSLRDVLQEIEGHRGYRPKASVTLLYNRVLPPRAPEHYAHDPDADLLRRCAAGTPDPYFRLLRQEAAREARRRLSASRSSSEHVQGGKDRDAEDREEGREQRPAREDRMSGALAGEAQ